jgi:hypothetical protein
MAADFANSGILSNLPASKRHAMYFRAIIDAVGKPVTRLPPHRSVRMAIADGSLHGGLFRFIQPRVPFVHVQRFPLRHMPLNVFGTLFSSKHEVVLESDVCQ